MLSRTAFLTLFGLFILMQSTFAQLDENTSIKEVIQVFFEGLHTGDTLKMKEATANYVIMQTIDRRKNDKYEIRNIEFNEFLGRVAKMDTETTIIEEKILSFDIKVDDHMANVWTDYEFYVNSNFSHCGVNSFQLFKEDGNWKIFYIIDTRRKQNCNK